ncbi:hypothetical protein TanjilG_31772 [Lupinus angustifolius]|uniref:Enhancer of mRNA-decapping protein 4 WD40 repeat region domain-containing protein n=1 Tax=Lupinus angustifolius TaxID=3871 RepID=A0A4P1RLX8_LUPAN|nr:PREDICTED: enhancer of mRNA-decapping protein 4-like [Lupinus angustifolius]OIW13883.1 hypothetical protein TanjilG_31772 [Lupinus angustifolius]
MAFQGNPNQHQQYLQTQKPHFDLNKVFNPTTTTTNNPLPSNSTNLNTSPSFPSPSPSTPPPSSFPIPSSSYPPPTATYPFQNPHYFPYPNLQQQHLHEMNATQRPIFQPSSSPNPNTTSSARLMAMMNTQNPPSNPDSPVMYQAAPSSNEFSVPTSPAVLPLTSAAPARILSTKFPRGRRLIGENVVYDIDFKLPSEVQPQLEVTPITKYASDPGLMLGRQIAVNRTYICYGLKLGAIRVLNINTALRYLLRGHTQKVTDMAFFAEDLHLLASASTDGRIFVWKINEDPDDEDKPQIGGKVITAIQILGESEPVHPRVCWHPHKQEILLVAIGNRILKVDTMKAGKGETFSAEEPLKCSIDKLIDGVHLVGKHDGNVTELSMCQWMKSRLASASEDGTVKIWEERNATPLAVIRPHDGKPVNFVTFLTAPHRADHIVLITAGPLNQEVKIWVSDNEEGWLLPSDSESWSCIQTLEIRSSSEANPEDAFFNQVVELPHAGLFLLANAKKNTIYSVHIEYGSNPTATRMDYISEFTVTMPILSLTGTSDSLPDGENIVQIYCVQTQAIQQYALNLSQCLPPPLDNADLEKPELNLSCSSNALYESSNLETKNMPQVHSSNSESAPVVSLPVNLSTSDIFGLPEASTSDIETKPNDLPSHNGFEHIQSSLPPHPPSPRLSHKLSDLKGSSNNLETNSANADHNSEQTNLESSAERKVESEKDNTTDVAAPGDSLRKNDGFIQNDVSMVSNSPATFKQPTHLITPSEIFSKASLSSENPQISQDMNAQDVAAHGDSENSEVEVKVVGETGSNQENNEYDRDRDSNTDVAEKKDKLFYSQASDLGIQMAREAYTTDEVRHADNIKTIDVPDQRSNAIEEEVQDTSKDAPVSISESEIVAVNFQSPLPALKGKRQKGNGFQVPGRSSTSPFDSTDSSNNQGGISGGLSKEAALPQLSTMHEMLSQLLSMQKEMQKQMTVMVSVPVTKESRRLEGSLGRSMEKVVKANSDALWARVQEENSKQEKLEQDCTQQITNLISNYVNKDMTTVLEKIIKKEISSIGSTVASSVSQIVIQTLEIRSSSEANPEDAFFNQVVELPHAGLFLLANAKKNTIYSVHIEYGSNPTATRMDYISEFTVTMPILSLTGTSDSLPDGENIVQIYCVQTQAIQQYALNLSQCLPPPLDNADLEKPELNLSCSSNALYESSNLETKNMPQVHSSNSESAPVVSLPVNLSTSDIFGLPEASTSDIETKPNDLPSHNGFEHIQSSLPPHPPSPRLSHKLSDLKGSSNNLETNSANADHNSEQTNLESSAERKVESEKDNTTDVAAPGDSLRKNDGFIQNDVSMVSNSPATFKQPTHLITPSEIFSKASLSSENPQISQDMNAQDVAAHGDSENSEVEVKVVGETGSNQENNEYDRDRDSNTDVAEKKDKLFYSQASDLGIQMAREAYTTDEVRHADNIKTIDVPDQRSNAIEEEVQDTSKDAPVSISESEIVAVNFQSPLPALKGKRQKGNGFQVPGRSSTSPFDSTDSSNNQGGISGGLSKEAALPQLSTMHEMLSQLLSMQKEMQKQMTVMVSVPVTKESRRLEGSLGRSMEKVVKANSDALWARVQEENSKQEKLEQDCTQQITNLISNYVNKDMTTVLEKIIKKEISSIGSTVASSVSQIVEKTVSSAIVESFQKGVGEKGLHQLEKSVSSKLEATMARQIQTHFRTSGKQALQEALRTSLEASIVPAFEKTCKAMFEQIDVTFENRLTKHTTAIQQQYDSTHSPLAMTLRETINSASSITQTLSAELAEGHRKLIEIAANSKVAADPFVTQINNGLHEMTEDPTKELSRLISEGKFEEAFIAALHRSDVSIVSWLCSQVDLAGILTMVPLPLSQGVLLSLLQQLSCDVNSETPKKLAWMTDVAAALNPVDPTISAHVRLILDQVYLTLGHHRTLSTTSPTEASTIRLLMHVINSVLVSCK